MHNIHHASCWLCTAERAQGISSEDCNTVQVPGILLTTPHLRALGTRQGLERQRLAWFPEGGGVAAAARRRLRGARRPQRIPVDEDTNQ